MNYLASPALVVAYAIAGTVNSDLTSEPLGNGNDGQPVYLRDIWPSNKQIGDAIAATIGPEMFQQNYADVFKGDTRWNTIASPNGALYAWDAHSTYIKNPPYFDGMTMQTEPVKDVRGARVLGLFADSITTDHISQPATSNRILLPDASCKNMAYSLPTSTATAAAVGMTMSWYAAPSPTSASKTSCSTAKKVGTHGIALKAGGPPEKMSIYDAAMKYNTDGVPLVVIAGKEYGTGSSRDWAAKGTKLLGVKAVIAENFERIHRSNLVGMGVLPLQFLDGQNAQTLGLDGSEIFDVTGLEGTISKHATVSAKQSDGSIKQFQVKVLLLTPKEVDYFTHGGLLQYVLRHLINTGKPA